MRGATGAFKLPRARELFSEFRIDRLLYDGPIFWKEERIYGLQVLATTARVYSSYS